ncbi:hypothetical protein VPH35_048764 [Triticum aestivum]
MYQHCQLQLLFIPEPLFINHCSHIFTILGHTMTIIDFIELSDDNIIDLSSDEETVQENQIATQDRATMLDKRGMFVLAGEGNQDAQAVFVAATKGTQEAAESGQALEATTSSLTTEKTPFVAASERRQDVLAVFVAASEGRQDAGESGNALEATPLSFVTEETPLDTATSPNCHRSPTSASFPSPTFTTPKTRTSKGGDAEAVRVKRNYRKKNYHTDTPRKSPRLIR